MPEPSPASIFPLVDISTAVTAPVPLPINTPFAVSDVAPVPPLATGNVPVTSLPKAVELSMVTHALPL